jgi:integrase
MDEGQPPRHCETFLALAERTREGNRTILPDDLLSKDEIQKLIKAAEHPRNKAYMAVADESGASPGEVLTMKVGSVTFDRYGAVIVVRGKKGERRIRLVASAAYLAAWLDVHPARSNRDTRYGSTSEPQITVRLSSTMRRGSCSGSWRNTRASRRG